MPKGGSGKIGKQLNAKIQSMRYITQEEKTNAIHKVSGITTTGRNDLQISLDVSRVLSPLARLNERRRKERWRPY